MDGSTALLEAVRRFEATLATAAPKPPISRLVCEDDTVSFTVTRPDGSMDRISVCFVDSAAYPHTCALFSASDATSNDEALLEQLQGLSERFQDQAPLERILPELLKALGCQAGSSGAANQGAGTPTPSAPRGTGSDADADMTAVSAESEDAGDDDNDDDEEDGGYDGMAQDSDAVGGSEDAVSEEEDDEDEREMMINCGRRQGRWERHEERVREAEASASSKGGLSHEEANAKKQQIFEPREAFLMLSRELLDILRRQLYDMFVDTVEDDVFAWSVELGSFDTNSNLYKDMQEIQRRHQYSFIKLILRFKRGLHPFYPPSVELVRPHFKGSIAAAVAVHPMLRLGSWDPWRPMEEVIRQIKQFLQAVARVDLDHPMNDISRFPLSSYRPVEVDLARLNALSGLELSCPDEPEIHQALSNFSHDQARMEALASDSSKKRTREPGPKDTKAVWARGTGYGFGERSQDPVWDARASEAAQRAKDDELRQLLENLGAHVAEDLQVTVDNSAIKKLAATAATAMAMPGAAAATSAPSSSPTPTAQPAGTSAGTGDGPSISAALQPEQEGQQQQQQHYSPDAGACVAALSSSCLMAFLAHELKSASFTDMCSRTPFYLAILGLCKVLAQHPQARQLLWQSASSSSGSAASLLTAMRDSAKQYARVTRPVFDNEVEEQKTQAAQLAITQAAVGMPIRPPGLTPQQETLQEMLGGLQLASQVQDVAGMLERNAAAGPSGAAAGASGSDSTSYCSVLQPLQVEYIPDLRSSSHHYASNATNEGVQPKARMSRLAKEIAGLQQLLPLSESSSVFVRVDEENVTLWRALITGPEDTPYSAGCFIFDFYFPPNYPSAPPQVQFKTTGGGRIRFNPNLYNNGKVCLSLLGTWEGAKGEGWNASASSALQVLLSIQSLILVPQPYFNEPGYERQYNSEDGKKQSREYNSAITDGTLRYAMIDLLQHPPKEFEAVINAHFKSRRQYILNMVQGWITAASEWNKSHAASLTALKKQLEPLLAKL